MSEHGDGADPKLDQDQEDEQQDKQQVMSPQPRSAIFGRGGVKVVIPKFTGKVEDWDA